MAYKVIGEFADLQDNRWLYRAGETYPRDGHTVSDERITELAGSDNRAGKPLIALVKAKTAKPEPKATKPAKKRVRKND